MIRIFGILHYHTTLRARKCSGSFGVFDVFDLAFPNAAVSDR